MVVLEDRPWPQGHKFVSLVLASRVQGLDLEGPGLSLEGLGLSLWILALTTTLFITNIAASLKGLNL